jgi:AcrR family transcriptional regulator
MEGSERDRAQRLPAGTHGIPADVVVRNQRERLVAAVAEACAEKGYAETSVADLSHRAGVSTATFYKLFAGKQECALEAHRELLARLLEEVDLACAATGDRDGKVRAGAGTVLELFAADAPTARLLTVEALAIGPAGSERHAAAIEAFASRLRAARDPAADSTEGTADWTRLAGVAALIGRQVMAGAAADLPQLEDEVVALVSASG